MERAKTRKSSKCDIVVRAVEATGRTLVLDEMALLQKRSNSVDDVSALLDEWWIAFEVVNANAVQHRVLEHADVPIKTRSVMTRQNDEGQTYR